MEHLLSPSDTESVRPGELRVAAGGGARQLVVVLEVYPTHVVFALAHPYVEYATDADVVVIPGPCGTAYPVVVCCSCIGTVHADRLDPPVGAVPPPVLNVARRYDPTGLSEDARWWVGARCTGPLDARWEYKAALRTTVAALAREHLADALDAEVSAVCRRGRCDGPPSCVRGAR